MTKRILVVDDDRSILKTFSRILEKSGYKVDTAQTATETLKKLRRHDYDVTLIDIELPDAKGTDLLLKLPKSPSMAKIVITGFSRSEYGEQAAENGADDYLVKPVKPEELLDAVARVTVK